MSRTPKVLAKRLHPAAALPRRMSEGAAGVDLFACLDDPRTVGPGDRVTIPTGLALAIPVGFEGQVRPRSGLARKHGLTVLNSPGTIDADYRGELQIILVNLGRHAYVVEHGQRIAQLVIAPVSMAEVEEMGQGEDLPGQTARGSAGFGSTGV